MNEADFNKFLNGGIEIEAIILKAGNSVRDNSKRELTVLYTDTRFTLMAIINYLLFLKSGVAGNSNKATNDKMTLISLFVQGLHFVEKLICEGQYFKASAVLKQDFEILARIKNINASEDKDGATPNIKNVPQGAKRFYGELNDIAHISKQEYLEKFLLKISSEEIKGVSPVPNFNAGLTKYLYEIHLWLMFQIILEHIEVLKELYGDPIPEERKEDILNFLTMVAKKFEKMRFKEMV